MSDTTTPNYGFDLPTVGASQDTWGGKLNANWTLADSAIHNLASGYLTLGGGTLSGALTIAPPSGYAILTLNKPTGANGNQVEGATAGSPRWVILLGDATAESGGNAGSNFQIGRFDDSGNLLGTPLSINRATGNVNVAQSLNVGAATVSGAITAASGAFSGLVTAGSIQSNSGVFQVAPNYYVGRSSSDFAWRFVENGTTNLMIGANGNATARGGLYAYNGSAALAAGADGFILQFWPNWYWDWNSTNGNLGWMANNQLFWFHRTTDNRCYNNLGPVGGVGPYENNSDARGKEDVADATLGLAEILRLRPVTFKRKPRRETTPAPRTELGFVAQELREVIPEAVSVVGFELPDGSGGIDSSDPTLATTLDAIVATLVNAVKELTERVAALELQLA